MDRPTAVRRPERPILEPLEPRILLHASGTYAEGDYVHQWIADQAYDFYSSQGQPGSSEVGLHLGTLGSSGNSWIGLGSTLNPWDYNGTDVIEGAQEEDTWGVWLRHFVQGGDPGELGTGLAKEWYDPMVDVLGMTVPSFILPGLGMTDILTDPQDGRYYSAYEAAQCMWDNAMGLYANDIDSAYYLLGRVAHLLSDVTVPAHVHLDRHAPLVDTTDTYESAVKSSTLYDGQDVRFGSYTANLARGPVRVYSSLLEIFSQTANYAENYASDDADGEWGTAGSFDPGQLGLADRHHPDQVSRSGGLSGVEVKTIADDLMPFAIEQTAALFKFFYDTVNLQTSNHRPVLTTPSVTPQSGSAANTYTFSVHYYDQDGDAPLVSGGQQYSLLYLSGGRMEEMSLVSGSADDGTYRVAVSGLTPGSYQHSFSFYDARGLDCVLGRLPGPYVSVPVGSDLQLQYHSWDDGPYHAALDNQHSDDDGYAEAGEAVNTWVCLRNAGASGVSNVRGWLSSSVGNVQITSSDVFFDAIAHDGQAWGGGKYYMFLNFSSTWTNLPFSLHLTYVKDGVGYRQDIPFSRTFYADGVQEPDIIIDQITLSDPAPNGDGDGIAESGERPDFRVRLKNNGWAAAYDVQLTVTDVKGTGFGSTCGGWLDYPDIGPNNTVDPLPGQVLCADRIPFNVAGPVTADFTITAAGGKQWFYDDYPLFNVQPAAWLYVEPHTWDFGVSPTTDDVPKAVVIHNDGTDTLQITGVVISDPDTTIGEPLPSVQSPWSIPAGGSRTVQVTIETSALNGQISRSLTFTPGANVRLTDDALPSNRITISGLVSDTPPAFQIPGAIPADGRTDVAGNTIVWVDNRNGNPDIYAFNLATGVTTPVCTNTANQGGPRVFGNIVAWHDSRNWGGSGSITYDIYAYNLATGQEFAVSTNTADERVVGVDGNLIAFTRVYHTWTEPSNYGSNPCNLFYYNTVDGQVTQVTYYSYSGHNPMDTVTSPNDFGGGVLTWQELHLEWNSTPSGYWKIAGSSIRMKIGVDSPPVQILGGSADNGPVTNGVQIAYSKYTGDYDQVWVWQDGQPLRQLTSENRDHGLDNLTIGSDVVVYNDAWYAGLFAFDLVSNSKSQVTQMGAVAPGTRMDGHLLAWQSSGGVYYAFLKEPDLSVAPADIAFSNASPLEGTTIDVQVTIHNLTTTAAPGPVTVKLYDGNPDSGGTHPVSDQTIPGGIAGRGHETVTFTGVPVGVEGTHHIYARVTPVGTENPGNNTTLKDLTARDSDTQGPSITNVVVAEFNGDGDGIVGADEQIQISWSLSDPSGIASTTLLVDGNPITPINGLPGGNPTSANCYAIVGPLTAVPHTWEIRATDADNANPTDPTTSTRTDGFSVVAAEEITILLNASALTDGQATPINFGTVVRGSAGVQRIFWVRNDGQQVLSLGAISVPSGFTVSGPAASVIPPGGTTHFTVTLETATADTFFGEVSLANSDWDNGDGIERPFNFPISGTVTDIAPYVTAVSLNDRPGRTVSSSEPSGIGVRRITVTLSEAVTFAAADVVVERYGTSGTLPTPTITGSGTGQMVIEFPIASVLDTWVKVTLRGDGTLKDLAGNLLDGEANGGGSGRGYIYSATADLPTGDGTAGGSAVFFVGSLRGDYQDDELIPGPPDGVITLSDVDGLAAAFQANSLDADFQDDELIPGPPDGCVTLSDVDGFAAAFQAGKTLPPLPAHLSYLTADLGAGAAPLGLAEDAGTAVAGYVFSAVPSPLVGEGGRRPGEGWRGTAPSPLTPPCLPAGRSHGWRSAVALEAAGALSAAAAPREAMASVLSVDTGSDATADDVLMGPLFATPSAAAQPQLEPDGGLPDWQAGLDLLSVPALGILVEV